MPPPSRGRFRGAIQVVQFNWPKVVGGTALGVVGLARWRRLPWWMRPVVLGAAVWTPLSVVASWWVYDLSPLRHWRFVTPLLPAVPRRALLVTAGFDEVSEPLRRALPGARVDVVDVVPDPDASVRRARRYYPSTAPVVAPDDLGRGRTESYDLVLFAQSAHELRDPVGRALALRRAADTLSDDGRVVVVEHRRDPVNLVAFGPGAWHFESERTWQRAFTDAGLDVERRRTVTPLVHVWVLR